VKVFNDYADFYDFFYQEKPYKQESEYIHSLLQEKAPGAKTIIEFGSGSGKHALHLAELGYTIQGIDQSQRMVDRAKKLVEITSTSKVSFTQGDIGKKKLRGKFDAGIALFHVMSYQTQTLDFLKTLKNMANHLKPGGVFIFDTWYGPAVLSDPPTPRGKKFNSPEYEILRFSQPELLINENQVNVHYELWVKNRKSLSVSTIRETHSMRYFFKPEMEMLLAIAGFSLLDSEEFLSRRPLSEKTWGSLWIARKNGDPLQN
jgi:SAM-dependent methyltransferase